jgi:hypothetical protein
MVYLRMSDGALHTATVDLSEGAVVPDEELPEILRPDVAHASGRPSAQ